MKCVNEKCKNDPTLSINSILVTVDGDFACCPQCQQEYEEEKRIFFKNIGNDEWLIS